MLHHTRPAAHPEADTLPAEEVSRSHLVVAEAARTHPAVEAVRTHPAAEGAARNRPVVGRSRPVGEDLRIRRQIDLVGGRRNHLELHLEDGLESSRLWHRSWSRWHRGAV